MMYLQISVVKYSIVQYSVFPAENTKRTKIYIFYIAAKNNYAKQCKRSFLEHFQLFIPEPTARSAIPGVIPGRGY